MPPFFLDFQNPQFNVRSFRDRLLNLYEWIGLWYIFAIAVNSNMKKTLFDLLPDFNFMDYSRKSSLSFTDMPLQLFVPTSATNEVCNPYTNLTLTLTITFEIYV